MTTINKFNLLDESWIPVVGNELVSLKLLFSKSEYLELGGNPMQKISLMKLLLAIAQAAYTPTDEEDWQSLGAEKLSLICLDYLEKWRDSFWLYGEKPFLQMVEIKKASCISFGGVLPEIAMGNTSLISKCQIEKELSDSDKALLIVSLMGFGFGGKKTDNTVSLSEGYLKKATGKPGTHLGYMGYLHNFVIGQNLKSTLWLNLLTHEQFEQKYPKGLGKAPWEKMPLGEDCSTAQELKDSYIGRLIPLSRFCLLSDAGLHYSEGISFTNHKEGGIDPSIAVDNVKKEPRAAWVDAEKRPWRLMTAFLSFLLASKNASMDCIHIKYGIKRARKNMPTFGIWSGGIKVSSNAGEQYVSGNDDFVESKTTFSSNIVGEDWFIKISQEMTTLESLSYDLFKAISNYYKNLKADGSKHARIATHLFWQLCERKAQSLFESEDPINLRKDFLHLALKAYDNYCPKGTSRQIDSWIKYRPKINKYLSNNN